ncbi:GNAT family N-acetyltransferase [Streptomyces sp. ACA25]|uniref:GNAT family N-acetyltransferase n=1 Tax=Streptomyces sp. ACA25 TaxID=3022596 RepID=UPI0023075D0B|nr:GNAT family N-acetyltransferase [Streptomyces sp. ACA25]MDB1086741.1 GNAT family N-acetyltransferase [Streptomyces sp. ACA25]
MAPVTDSAVTVRPYRPSDHDALRDICVRTGHVGGDATGHFQDPEILPALFASPYAALVPDLVFVADDGTRPLGYVLGAADSTRFYARFRERWLPTVAGRFPAPDGPPQTPDERLRDLLHHAERMLVPEFAEEYPAHLHIDLLPHGQGRGLGRRLMETYLAALRNRGVPGVHLGMNPENTGARAFYDRLGFHELAPPDPGHPTLYLARRL